MKSLPLLALLAALPLTQIRTENLNAPIPDPQFPSSTPPTINCPPNATVSLAPAQCDTVINYTVTASDDKPGHTLAQIAGLPSGAAFPVGLTTNTFRVTDSDGNTASCSFSVQVLNFQVGLNCDDLHQVSLGAGCEYLLKATDVLENTNFGCPAQYEVGLDRVAPFGNGPWATPPLLTAADHGKTYGYRVRDPQNNYSCWGLVKIVDFVLPVLACPDITVSCAVNNFQPAFLRDSLGIAGAFPTVTDNCGGATLQPLYYDIETQLGCDSSFFRKISRRWTANDANQNTATCLQKIYLTHVRLPDVQFPPDLTLSCQAPSFTPASTGKPFVQVGNFRFSDLCFVGYNYDDTHAPGCGNTRQITRTWEVVDFCNGAETTHIQHIEISDRNPPIITCPENLTVTATPENCATEVDLPDAVISDACSRPVGLTAYWSAGDSLVATLSDFLANDPAKKDTLALLGVAEDFPLGATTLTYRAWDECGNVGECQFELSVWDGVPPLAVCKSGLTVALESDGRALLPALALDGGSSDTCGAAVFFKARRVVAASCEPNNGFSDFVTFCCADAGGTVDIQLRAYDVPLPDGEVADDFAQSQLSQCVARVSVLDTLPLQCVAPPDVIVNCNQFDPTFSAYDLGYTQTCQATEATVLTDYADFNLTCQTGHIRRIWRVISGAQDTLDCVQHIEVEADTALMRGFFVRFPDDRVVTNCVTDTLWGEPQIFGAACAGMEISFSEVRFTVVPDACYRIERTWRVKNGCADDPAEPPVQVPNPAPNASPNHATNLVGPTLSPAGTDAPWAPTLVSITPNSPPQDFSLYWNQSASGYEYRQSIKIIDVIKPLVSGCPATSPHFPDSNAMANNDPQLWNSLNFNALQPDLPEAGVVFAHDAQDCALTPQVDARFLLFLDINGDGIQETVINSENQPVAPGVIWHNNYQAPNYIGNTTTAFDSRPVPSAQKYRFAVQNTQTGTGRWQLRPAWNTSAAPTQFVPMQLPHGRHRMRFFVEDQCGNETLCDYFFTISGATQPAYDVAGRISTAANEGVANVSARLEATPNGGGTPVVWTEQTDTSGRFQRLAGVPALADYTLRPGLNADPLNGVSTFDMLLISKHILAVDTLDSPYKLIAADANQSGSITSFDILEIRKLVLGLTSSFANAPSWRFVPRSFVFQNPALPFQPPFPEQITRTDVVANYLNEDFVGIKVGDVNGSATPHFSGNADERAAGPRLFFETENRRFEPGEVFKIQFEPAAEAEAWQFSLEHPGLEILEILPAAGASVENFAVFPAEKTVTATEFGPAAKRGFGLIVKALQAGSLSKNLRMSDGITRSESVFASGEAGGVALRFLDGQTTFEAVPGFKIYPPQPNPATAFADLRFHLPTAAQVRLTVADALGKVLISKNLDCPAGLNTQRLDLAGLGAAAGVFVCKIESEAGSGTVWVVLKG